MDFTQEGYLMHMNIWGAMCRKNIRRMELLFASDNELYGGNVQYKIKEIYTAKANALLIPMGGFTAKYFLIE